MGTYKQKPALGRILFHIVHESVAAQTPFPGQLSRQQVRALLRTTARLKPQSRYFIEGEDDGVYLGCLIMGHTLPDGQFRYTCAIFNEDTFPALQGYVSIVPSRTVGNPQITQLHSTGWKPVPISEAGRLAATRVALTALAEMHLKNLTEGTQSVPIGLLLGESDSPPVDEECTSRIMNALTRKMFLTVAVVPLERVRPFSSDYQLKLDTEIVKAISVKLRNEDMKILVYWAGETFISSDDYYLYSAYKLLNKQNVSVVIMGDFPPDLCEVIARGGPELMPPILIAKGGETVPGMNDELRNWKQKDALRSSKRPPPAELMVTWMTFAELISRVELRERDLHDFLIEHPLIMGGNWDVADAEVDLGGKYVADFVLRAKRLMPTVRLVELENSRHRIFTKGLRETKEVTHAIQQVNDWLRWWRQNTQHPVVAPSEGVEPDGLVVIGRSTLLTNEQQKSLAHNNQSRSIKVITYDELLDDFGSLILHLLDNTRDDFEEA